MPHLWDAGAWAHNTNNWKSIKHLTFDHPHVSKGHAYRGACWNLLNITCTVRNPSHSSRVTSTNYSNIYFRACEKVLTKGDISGTFSSAYFTKEALIHFMMILRTAHRFSWPLHQTLGYSDLEISLDNSVSSFCENEKCFRQDKNYGEKISSQDK